MATYNENKDFLRAMIPEDLLDEAIDWINDHMEPEEVFKNSALEDWAEENGFVKEEE